MSYRGASKEKTTCFWCYRMEIMKYTYTNFYPKLRCKRIRIWWWDRFVVERKLLFYEALLHNAEWNKITYPKYERQHMRIWVMQAPGQLETHKQALDNQTDDQLFFYQPANQTLQSYHAEPGLWIFIVVIPKWGLAGSQTAKAPFGMTSTMELRSVVFVQ